MPSREVGCYSIVEDRSFLWSAPVAFRRVALETPEWTSRDSNHHRQSVSAGKTNAIPTEPSGRLIVEDRSTISGSCGRVWSPDSRESPSPVKSSTLLVRGIEMVSVSASKTSMIQF